MTKAGQILKWMRIIVVIACLCLGSNSPARAQNTVFDQIVHFGHYTYTYDAYGNVTSTTWVELFVGTYGTYLTSTYYNMPGNILLDNAGNAFTQPSTTTIIGATCGGSTGASSGVCNSTTAELTKVIHQGYYTYTYDYWGNITGSVWNEVWTGTQTDWFTSPYQNQSTYCTSGWYYSNCYPLVTLDDAGNPFTPLTQADLMAQTQASAANPGTINIPGYTPPTASGAVPKNTSEYPTPGYNYPPAGSYPAIPASPTAACADTRTDAADGTASAAAGSPAQMGTDTKLIAQNLNAWGQDKLTVQKQSMALVKPINLAADYCLQKLLDLMKKIGDLAGMGFSDLSAALTKAIVDQIVGQIAAALAKSCTVVAGDLSGAFAALQTDVSNAFCLPMPGLDIQGINSTGLKVPTIPCKGASILDATGPGPWSAPTTASSSWKKYQLFGK